MPDLTAVAAIGGLILGFFASVREFLKFLSERKDAKQKKEKEEKQEEEKKPSLALSSTNEALTMLQGLLQASGQREAQLRQLLDDADARADKLEEKVDFQQSQIYEMRALMREKDRQIKDLQEEVQLLRERLNAHEGRNSGSQS